MGTALRFTSLTGGVSEFATVEGDRHMEARKRKHTRRERGGNQNVWIREDPLRKRKPLLWARKVQGRGQDMTAMPWNRQELRGAGRTWRPGPLWVNGHLSGLSRVLSSAGRPEGKN